MNEGWTEASVGELATVFDGPHATPTKTPTGPWYLSISSLVDGRLDLSASAHLSEDDFPRWTKRVSPRPGDTLFSYETRLGEAAHWRLTDRAAIGRRMGILRPKDGVDPRFLTYAYLGPQFQEEINRRAIRGATVDRIPIADLPSWPIVVPQLPEQRRIAGVLGALDDLIEADRSIQHAVLDLAQAIYGRAVSDSDEEIPLSEVGTWFSGGTPSTSNAAYWGGSTPWISAASLHSFFVNTSERSLTMEGVQNGTRVVPEGSILFVVRGMSLKSEFRVGIAQRTVAFGQDCKAIVVHAGLPRATMAVALLTRSQDVLQLVDEASHGTGRLQTDRVEGLAIQLPAPACVPAVEAAISALLRLGADAASSVAALSRARDELLPLLLSGRVSVREAAE